MENNNDNQNRNVSNSREVVNKNTSKYNLLSKSLRKIWDSKRTIRSI